MENFMSYKLVYKSIKKKNMTKEADYALSAEFRINWNVSPADG